MSSSLSISLSWSKFTKGKSLWLTNPSIIGGKLYKSLRVRSIIHSESFLTSDLFTSVRKDSYKSRYYFQFILVNLLLTIFVNIHCVFLLLNQHHIYMKNNYTRRCLSVVIILLFLWPTISTKYQIHQQRSQWWCNFLEGSFYLKVRVGGFWYYFIQLLVIQIKLTPNVIRTRKPIYKSLNFPCWVAHGTCFGSICLDSIFNLARAIQKNLLLPQACHRKFITQLRTSQLHKYLFSFL